MKKLLDVQIKRSPQQLIVQVAAPMMGDVVILKVQPGDIVKPGQVVAVLSAMKMEMAVQTQVAGKVNFY